MKTFLFNCLAWQCQLIYTALKWTPSKQYNVFMFQHYAMISTVLNKTKYQYK